jgi:hypothetical protein
MAAILKLVTPTIGDVSLIAAVGAGLRGQQWFPKSTSPIYGSIPPYVTEAMDIKADRTSDDGLATTLQTLNDARRWADLFRRDPVAEAPCWLYAKMDGETGSRRAYVRRITAEWRDNQISATGHAANHDALLRVGMERHPYWESDYFHSLAQSEDLGGAAVRWDWAGPTKGDVAGRIWRFALRAPIDVGDVDRVWLGLRSKRKHHDATNFPNLLECEAASTTAGTDCGAPTTDAAASPGGGGNTKRVVTFATTTTWAKRLTYSLVCTDYEAIALVLWLLRYKVDASTTCEVQLRWGLPGAADSSFVQGPKVEVSNTSYDYAEMGVSQQPLGLIHSDTFVAVLAGATIDVQLWARRTYGTGSLHLDCFCPIPIDEGWMVVKNIGGIGSNERLLWYMQSPDDRDLAVVGTYPGAMYKIPDWDTWNFRVPPSNFESDAFSIYGVFARASSAVLADQLRVRFMDYYPRWCDLRGGM